MIDLQATVLLVPKRYPTSKSKTRVKIDEETYIFTRTELSFQAPFKEHNINIHDGILENLTLENNKLIL